MNAELLAGNIAAHWVQSGLLAGALLVALRLLRVSDPRLRLAVLQLGFVAIVLLPMMQPRRLPAAPLPAPVEAAMAHTADVADASSQTATFAAPREAWFARATTFVAIVAAGIAVRLLWVLYGLVQLLRFSRRSPEVPAPAVAGELEAQMGIAPRYVRQTDSRGPWTFGFLRSTVALPARFDALDPGFQRAVICHELHHVKRRDVVAAFAEELATAVLWFHPWVWLLRARIRVAREQVVDASVVALLSNRDEYVRCLINMSGHDLAPHLSQASAGMLRPRELRARVDAIFQEVQMSRTRIIAAAFALVTVAGATGWAAVSAVPLRAEPGPLGVDAPSRSSATVSMELTSATASPSNITVPVIRTSPSNAVPGPNVVPGFSRTPDMQAQAAPATPRRQINMVYPEYPQDALARGIRGTVIVDTTINVTGDVTTAAVQSGPQELRASAFKAALALKFTKGTSTTAIPIAFHYMLTDLSWGVKIGDALPNIGLRPLVTSSDGRSTSPDTGAEPDATGAYRVGSTIRPPRKIVNVDPEYPSLARSANVQGVVILEARIDESGNVSDTRVLRSIPLLDQAAVDAVKQWKYEPTLMNGVAVPVIMTVTVNFASINTPRVYLYPPDGSTPTLRLPPPGVEGGANVALGKLRFRADQSAPGEVTLSIFDADTGAHLGDMVLRPGDPVVQTPTTPAIGVQLRGGQ